MMRSPLAAMLLILFCAAATKADNPVYNIYEVQFSDASQNWESPYIGEIIDCVGGIVTHKLSQRIIIQDPQLGSQWAAIEIRGYPVYPIGLELGDQVDLQTVYVDEFRGVTTLQYYSASSYTVNSSGNPIPDPTPLTLADIQYPADPAISEPYAAMLVSFLEPIEIGQLHLGAHEDNYELLGESGVVAWSSDYGNADIDTTYYVSTGDLYSRLTGIVQRYSDDESWDYYQLLPRYIADYEVASHIDTPDPLTRAGELRLEMSGPNPFTTQTGFQVFLSRPTHLTVEIHDISGRRIDRLFSACASAGIQTIRWNGQSRNQSPLPTGIYLIKATTSSGSFSKRLLLTR
jgi:FlgD Ig-like domain